MSRATLAKAMAEALLKKIDTPEKAIGLVGKERENYLKALDVVYGERAKRAADLGFDQKAFHGSGKGFVGDSFNSKFQGSNTGAKTGAASWFTSDPNVANEYSLYGFENAEQSIPVLLKKSSFEIEPVGGRTLKPSIRKAKVDDAASRGKSIKFENMHDDPSGVLETTSDVFALTNPKDVRSINAAFDPRFKDSAKIMAGVSPAASEMMDQQKSPLDYIGDAYDKYREKIADPFLGALKKRLTPDVLLPTTGDSFQTRSKGTDMVIDTVADPINFVPGAAGVGAAAMEAMANFRPKKGK